MSTFLQSSLSVNWRWRSNCDMHCDTYTANYFYWEITVISWQSLLSLSLYEYFGLSFRFNPCSFSSRSESYSVCFRNVSFFQPPPSPSDLRMTHYRPRAVIFCKMIAWTRGELIFYSFENTNLLWLLKLTAFTPRKDHIGHSFVLWINELSSW